MVRWMMLAALAVSTAAAAQEGQASDPPKRVRSVILYGDQKCPKADSTDEIVVCSNGGDSPYRIPPKLRESRPSPASNSWVNKAQTIQEVSRKGLPNSCSAVGSGGQTGCNRALLDQWAEERRAKGESVGILHGDPDDQ